MTQSNQLTNREQEMVKLLLEGKSNKQIASSFGISIRTVEFHLKNIYSKFQVSSRIELVLKLVNTTGKVEIKKLGYSTVVGSGESAENGDTLNSRETVSIIGQELKMKNIMNTKHIPVGMFAALLTGFLWIIILQHFGHMPMDALLPWVLPLVLILAGIGLPVGLVGKRNESTLQKVFFSTLFGTGLGAITMLPLTGFVVYPLAKLVERLGLIDRSAISNDVASTLVIVSMIMMWLIVGSAIGIMLLSVIVKKRGQTTFQTPASEHRL